MGRSKYLLLLLVALTKLLSTAHSTPQPQQTQHHQEDQPYSQFPSALSSPQSHQISSQPRVDQASFLDSTQSVGPFYQPALIGFRCEGAQETTPEGITIVEANRPIKLTLFGDSFTTETIVAFTSEFVSQHHPEPVVSDQHRPHQTLGRVRADSSRVEDQRATERRRLASRATGSHDIGDSKTANAATAAGANESFESSSLSARAWTPEKQESLLPAPGNQTTTQQPSPSVRQRAHPAIHRVKRTLSTPPPLPTSSADQQQQLPPGGRRRLLGPNHDCTDLNRITSYRLKRRDIISPNVAVLTVSLPEIDSQTSDGLYYYFCLKQPATSGSSLAQDWPLAPGSVGKLLTLNSSSTTATSGGGGSSSSERLTWVHQGEEWWLTLKVEPPILSVANDCVLIVLLLFLSAVTSGLNLGLMSLDMNELAVIGSCGDPAERSYARTIAPLRKRGNYLLCSLLLGNVMVNSTLTVILEEMTSGLVAVIGSTLAIVILGEIVPQAFCARKGLAIGAKTIYLTYAFMLLTFPLSYPIACLLDCVLGEEKGNVYDRERLMEFIRITGHHTQLEADEVAIISGALKLKKIKVDQIMTRIEDVFMLPIDCILNRETIKRIIEKGYSRIPVYEFGDRRQIVALILAKDLALLDPDDPIPLANMLAYCKHPMIYIEDTRTLDVALNEFKTGKSHMAVVRQIYDDGEVDKYYEAIGVVTLEDVIEEVLQTEINDETDTLSDNRRKRRRADAQVSHLIDELTARSLSSSATLATALESGGAIANSNSKLHGDGGCSTGGSLLLSNNLTSPLAIVATDAATATMPQQQLITTASCSHADSARGDGRPPSALLSAAFSASSPMANANLRRRSQANVAVAAAAAAAGAKPSGNEAAPTPAADANRQQ